MFRKLTVVYVVAAVACSEGAGGPSAPAPGGSRGPLTLMKLSGDSQTATVSSPVGVPPSVRVVVDQEPIAGVSVRFAVAAGNGSVAGQIAVTDSLGVATVGRWALGTRAGSNALSATVDGVTPVTFTANGTAGPLARVAPATAGLVVGTVGAAVKVPPAVRATDAYDNPIQSVAVTFAVTSGGGTATGTSPRTDTLGIAAVGSWTLGTVAGANTLTASVPSLASVAFSATGQAGPPASVTRAAADSQVANLQSPVDTAPAVTLRDAYGNPAAGVVVTFSVASGGGTVAGATQTTDAAGRAQVGTWTLGPAPGINTLAASFAGLPPVIFTATGVDRCTTPVPYALGSSIDGSLSFASCQLPSGEFSDLYSVSPSGTARARLDMTSMSLVSHLSLLDANGALVLSTPYYCGWDDCSGTDSIRVLLGAGPYLVQATGYAYDYNDNILGGVVGPYTLSSGALPEDVHSCSGQEPTYVLPGVTTTQRVDSTDCAASFRSSHYYYDQVSIYMTAGRTYTISMSSVEFDTYLELWAAGPTLYLPGPVAFNDDLDGSSNSQIAFTPTVSGLYVVEPETYQPEATGTYTLAVAATGAPPAGLRAAHPAEGSPGVSGLRPTAFTRPSFIPRPPKP